MAFSDDFINYFKSVIPGAAEVSGGKELLIRCRYCADSADPNHAHMYVHVPQSEDDVPTFYCFKCHTSGVLDSKTLIEWGLYDPMIGVQLDKSIKLAAKTNRGRSYSKTWYNFFPGVLDEQLALAKVAYVNSRIGTNLSIRDCILDKIVLNLGDALQINHVENLTRHPNIVQELNDYFVGFLSLDGNFVNLRRTIHEGVVYKGIDKRYINYNIFDKKDNTEKMYVTMPYPIDLCCPQRVDLHVAEGPFDILSIKHNLRGNAPGIYAAVTGSGYKGLVMHLVTTMKLFYFTVHIYPDNDDPGSDYVMRELKDMIAPFGAQLIVHRNVHQGEKDFGVPLDRIDERIVML